MGETKNLSSQEAIKKIQTIAGETDFCMFITLLGEKPLQGRPMSTQKIDDDGNIWFFSQESSNKNMQIKSDDHVQLFYSNNKSSEFLSVYGSAEVLKDTTKAKELWTPWVKTWFPDGPDDPNLTLIKVTPLDSYYWDTKNNRLVSLIKIAVGALTGKEMDDSREGGIKI
ncbi:MAG: hypothetical protein NVS3B19_16340 [Ginsengibacter sp.]